MWLLPGMEKKAPCPTFLKCYNSSSYARGVAAHSSLSVEHLSLLVYVPQGATGRAPVQVTVDGLSSSTTSDFSISYARPHVLACTHSLVSLTAISRFLVDTSGLGSMHRWLSRLGEKHV